MTISTTGKKQIRPDAEPIFDASVFVDPSSYSSDSSVFETPPRKCVRSLMNVNFEDLLLEPDILKSDSIQSDHSIAGPSTRQVEHLIESSMDVDLEVVLEEHEISKSDSIQSNLNVAGPSTRRVEHEIKSCESENINLSSINWKKTSEEGTGSTTDITETASETEEMIESLVKQKSLPSGISAPKKGFTNLSDRQVKKRKRYVGDLSSSDFSTPEKRRRNLTFVKNFDKKRRVQIHQFQMTVRRLKLKITYFQQLIDHLKEKCLISEASESTIKASLSGPAQDIFGRMLKGPARQKYNPSLRSFALTLAFYSPKAYNFVRNTFNRSLPHLGTISRWYQSIDSSPGFTTEALNALTLKQKSASYPLLCNLVLDEMSIRRQVEWTGKKFTGYVDVGTNIDSDTLPEAKEVLVFMLVCINASWKIPVGYFLLDGLSAAELVKKCLEFVHKSGVIVTSLTFDGAPANISMCEKLGANFSDHLNLKTNFDHPVTKELVFNYLDAYHMIKLVRNCLASQAELVDENKKTIKWNFITELVKLQNKEGLHAATKLRKRHVEWQREKMKVRLATQTISKSVSDALTFLREDLMCPDFEGSEAISTFLLLFNDLFDIFNSRNIFSKYSFKKPLSEKNITTVLEFFQRVKLYITGLSLKGRPVLSSQRKTGFLGFLICLKSLEDMYGHLVHKKHLLNYILTYKLSQDHLELFFGAVRSKGGFNNNPTARQFEASYKRLLVHSEIRAPTTGNAIDLESIEILTCGSEPNSLRTEAGENLDESSEYLNYMESVKHDIETNYLMSNAWDLTIYVEDIVSYISGFVVKGLKKLLLVENVFYYWKPMKLNHVYSLENLW